jgi:ATP-dependent DNA helicase RecQ
VTLDLAAIRRSARETLGHRSLLPGQAEAIRAITDGRDTLAILPTGGGKSAVYQLAGLEIEGPTLVVSPLVALQHDQLGALVELGLPAAVVNGSVTDGARADAFARFERGELEFLLLAPEQLADDDALVRLRAGAPSLFVVDEAHCVAEWGHDFRPEYRRLGAVADALGRPPILALTATASPLLRADIVERLGLRDPVIVARGFDRPNLTLRVEQHADAAAKRRAVVDRAATLRPPGIVYVATRRASEAVAGDLADRGVAAAAYHAGMSAPRRTQTQDAFMADRLAVVVATIAFGMGIDKPDVRFVLHHDVPESLDAYHQEIGRAGRDDEPSEVVLFHRAEDLGLRRYQAAPARISEADVARVLRVLRRRPGLDVATIAGAATLSRRRTDAVLARLEELGAIRVDHAGRAVAAEDVDAGRAAHDAALAQERRRVVEQSRVDMIRGYAESAGCRRAALLGYFGEPFDPPCGNCDRCLAGGAGRAADPVAEALPWSVDQRVRHPVFGAGVVTALGDGQVTVAFEDVGYRTIHADLAEELRLLVPAGD